MRTLFLNPNSSAAVTSRLRALIARDGGPAFEWEVRCMADAPELIASEQDNLRAEALLQRELPAIAGAPGRLVLMSSLDSGYEAARRAMGERVCGFTRGVLAWHARSGRRLQVLTFGPGMAPLYRRLFQDSGHAAVVESHSVLDLGPSAALASSAATLDALRRSCGELASRSDAPVFVVGAAGLQLSLQLRDEGFTNLVDPVADLLQYLQQASVS